MATKRSKKPSKKDIENARNVLEYYMELALEMPDGTIGDAFDTCAWFLKGDVEKKFMDKLGHL